MPFLRYFNNLNLRLPRLIWLFLLFAGCLLCGSALAQRSPQRQTVVIDAGHGGHDPGALGVKAKEKNINLAVSLKLGKLISGSSKNVKVIYTRTTDHFVELYRRAGIANDAKADVFISVHCNANKNRALRGAETYVMGLHRSKANLDIAKTENAAILLESDYRSTYEGFDPNSDESYIIFSLNQNRNLEKSTEFAAAIQEQMVERVGLNNRGVRQAGFLVLYKTTMPSVLVELGYLSNVEEEKFLMSEKGQDFIAAAIFRAYKVIYGADDAEGAAEGPAKSTEPPAAGKTNPEVKPDSGKAQPETVSKVVEKPQQKPPAATDSKVEGKLSYRVQIATESSEIKTTAPKFSKFNGVKMYRHGGMYKYTVGDEDNLATALRLLDEVRQKGVKDAFIVIFRNGARIPQPEADRLMKN